MTLTGLERQQWARRSTPSARAWLTRRYLPLAASLAKRYSDGPAADPDLLQVACVGLIKAIDRYDPATGYAFSSYAVPVIDGALRHHFRYGWAVHVPRDAQRANRHLRVAASLDEPTPDGEMRWNPGAIDPGYEQVEDRMMLAAALRHVPVRERQVVWLHAQGECNARIGAVVGCSKQHVGRMFAATLGRLRPMLEAA